MVAAYKEHSQFIMILTIMYVSGVWGGPIIYPMLPMFLILFGLKQRYFELFITAIWLLMLSDYVPVRNATYDDLQFAKDLKFLVPLVLTGFIVRDLKSFTPFPKMILWFVPFFIVTIIALQFSLKPTVAIQKTMSFFLMYLSIPAYVVHLHNTQGERFWKALVTFLIGMLSIGIVLGFVAPDIGMLGGRFKSVLGNPNGLGIFLNLVFILWISLENLKLVVFTKQERRYILFVLIFSLLWCGSRNAMLSMFIFYIVHRLVRVHWFIAILVVIVLITYSELIFDVIISIIEFYNLEEYFRVESIETGSGRDIAWLFAWGQIQDSFFVGGGFGHDENIMRQNYYWLGILGHDGGVHNSYLSMWFDSGIFGVFLYFFGFFRILLKAMKKNYLALAFLISMLLNITYESWLVASLNPFTIMFLTIMTIFFMRWDANEVAEEKEEVNETNLAYSS